MRLAKWPWHSSCGSTLSKTKIQFIVLIGNLSPPVHIVMASSGGKDNPCLTVLMWDSKTVVDGTCNVPIPLNAK